jgi:hypothetical protein
MTENLVPGLMDRSMNAQSLIKIALAVAAFQCASSWASAEIADAPSTASGCVLPAKHMQRLELIFGLSGKMGPVSPRAWSAFVDREISPRFPDGFSVFDGSGQWRNAQGKISREASRLLLIWYEADATSNAKIEAIRDAYKKRFHQESVLRADELSCVSF